MFSLCCQVYIFFSYDIVTFSFYFIFFNLLCLQGKPIFLNNNNIQSIVLVFCYKKVLLDLFNFLLQICNNIVMDNDKYPRKNSKCNKKLDLLNTFFGTAYKSFYCWCSIDKKYRWYRQYRYRLQMLVSVVVSASA